MVESPSKPSDYKRSVVTFIDILGFSDVVRDRSATEINDMLDLLSEAAATQPLFGDTEVLSFSDSVIRTRRCGEAVLSAVVIEIRELAVAQCDLALEGVLIRGGMTTGDVSVSDGRVFGPGFIRAYELETRFAGSPRIVIDTALIPELRKQRTTANPDYQHDIQLVRQWMTQGDDGLWFVDYLRNARAAGAPDYHLPMMKRHRTMIIEQARGLDLSSALVPKFLWLAQYHNRVATKMHPDNESIRLGRKDIPIFDQLLLPKRRRKSAGGPRSRPG